MCKKNLRASHGRILAIMLKSSIIVQIFFVVFLSAGEVVGRLGQFLLDKSGQILLTRRWSRHFEDISENKGDNTSSDLGNGTAVGVCEVTEAVSALRNGKAGDVDKIGPEAVKRSGVPAFRGRTESPGWHFRA